MKIIMTLTISAIAASSALATIQHTNPSGRLGMRRITTYRRDCPESGCVPGRMPVQGKYNVSEYSSESDAKAVVKRKEDSIGNENTDNENTNNNSNSTSKHIANYAVRLDNSNSNSNGSQEKDKDVNNNEKDKYDSDSDTEDTADTNDKSRGNRNNSSSTSTSKFNYAVNFAANTNTDQNKQVNNSQHNNNDSINNNDPDYVDNTKDTKSRGDRNSSSSSSSSIYIANFVANSKDKNDNANGDNQLSGSDIFNGSATPFTPNIGVCDNGTYVDDDLVVALNRQQYGSDNISEYCNSCIQVTGDIGEIVLTVIGVCEECEENNLDIATGAFNKIISDPEQGDITWQFVDC